MAQEAISVWVYDKHKKKRSKVTLSIPSTERDRKKTKRASFANFIHQKDASIANYVISNCFSKRISLYTVHENFIVTPVNTEFVTQCYTSAFQNLGDPLSQVNHFLFLNVINYSSVRGEIHYSDMCRYVASNKDREGHSSIVCGSSVLDLLERALNELVPQDLKSKDKRVWCQHRDSLLKSYREYVSSLEMDGNDNLGYPTRYNSFMQLLKRNPCRLALHP